MNGSVLPLFYTDLLPLHSVQHREWRRATTDRLAWLVNHNLVPLTVDEFGIAQHHFPIVFSLDERPMPLALMGLAPGGNALVDATGLPQPGVYMPAYARRYPFMLARLGGKASQLTLCAVPTSELVGHLEEGQPLFKSDAPSQTCLDVLAFCEEFERAGERTQSFITELVKYDLLVEGRTVIRHASGEESAYNGFRVIDMARLRKVKSYVLGKWVENGILEWVYAHHFSLSMMTKLAHSGRGEELLLSEDMCASA